MALKRPPYSKLLSDRASHKYSWWLLIGADAWTEAAIWAEQDHRVFTICPPGEDPYKFDWSFYRNAPPPVGLVRCGDVDGSQLQTLVRVMLSSGSPRIYDLLEDVIYDIKKVAA